MQSELCINWNPIPKQFDANWQIDVINFEDDQEKISLVVSAFVDGTDETEIWRLDFYNSPVYRKRLLNYSKTGIITSPDEKSAFWEIQSSLFLMESGILHAYPHGQYHHYVVRYTIHDVFEILAEDWRCTILPAN